MDGGLKYLSFHIKPNGYRSLRLVLVVTKKWKEGKSLVLSLVISRRQASSCSICASIYACLLAHLSQLPVGIMTRIQSIFTSFFWKRAQKPSGFHLASWDLIAKPKALGGWGIRNLTWFGQALAIKSLWRALFGKGLWSKSFKCKYLRGVEAICWLHSGISKFPIASIFCKHLFSSLPLLKNRVA